MNELVLSVCIPTFGRIEILKETLESIYSQDTDLSAFEVCVSDNSPTTETQEMISEFFSGKTNLRYRRSDCSGYLNSVAALKMGRGRYLKLLNNYSKLLPQSLSRMISVIDGTNQDTALLFAFGIDGLPRSLTELKSFDSFLDALSIHSTWSSAFGIWKADFEHIVDEVPVPTKEFPHTSLLFKMTDKSAYVIDNNVYVSNIPLGSKGGYNLAEYFGGVFVGMVEALFEQRDITEATLRKIKAQTLSFISKWYIMTLFDREKYTFSFENMHSVLIRRFGMSGVLSFWLFNSYFFGRRVLKSLIKMVKTGAYGRTDDEVSDQESD